MWMIVVNHIRATEIIDFLLKAVIMNEYSWNHNNKIWKTLQHYLSINEIHTRNIYMMDKGFEYQKTS